jgi:predicted RNA-binding Zn ribbon-like protein
MADAEDEHSILDALEPTKQLGRGIPDEESSILDDINHLREHIQTLEEAARAARAVEFDQIRTVVEQLEAVAAAAKAVERDLSQELATTNRLSVSTARLVRDQLAATLHALAEALVVRDRSGERQAH